MAGHAPQESALNRLSRLLTMVPWLVNRQGIDLEAAADGLGITVEQLDSDLSLLFLCGYGQMPDELIDADWEGGRVFIRNADTIARPLRLGLDEAVALIVGLRALLAVPGLGERDAVQRALAKLEAATGAVGAAASSVDVHLADVTDDVDEALVARAREATERHRRLRMRYLVPGRDESTERMVDPLRLVTMDGRTYLEGWCHRAEGMRMFRLDRVEELELTDEDGTPPADARPRDLGQGIFQPAPDALLVTLRLERSARWVPDYYPVEAVRELGDGRIEVDLRTGDTEWLVRMLLRLGGQAVVTTPADLAGQVRAAAEAALEGYAVGGPGA